MNEALENALIEAIWNAYRAHYEANAVWDTDPTAPRRYDEAEARRKRLTAALCDGNEELEAYMNDHVYDLIDEGPAWLGRMFRDQRAWLAFEKVDSAMCVLADYRWARNELVAR